MEIKVKLQRLKTGRHGQFVMTIPQAMLRHFLKWKKGDTLSVKLCKDEKSITVRKDD